MLSGLDCGLSSRRYKSIWQSRISVPVINQTEEDVKQDIDTNRPMVKRSLRLLTYDHPI